MKRTSNNGARVNPRNPLVVSAVDIAIAVAYSIALVKTPVRFVRDSVLARLAGLLRYIADKSARGVYTALGSAVNNKLTRRISPSVSYLDEKIENICTVSGRWAGNVLVFPFTLAFYFLASVYASLFSIVAYTVLSARFTLSAVWMIVSGTAKECYDDVSLRTRKEVEETCKNMASKAAFALFLVSLKILIMGVIAPVVVLVLYALLKTLCLLQAPILAPVYMISSVFGLDNRFNIYNYKSEIGALHGYIHDTMEKKHNSGHFFPVYARDRLIKEVTTGDIDSTNTVARKEATSEDIDSTNTVNPEQAATELTSLTVEPGAQQQQVSAA